MNSTFYWEAVMLNHSILNESERILLAKVIADRTLSILTDNQGQLVIYTGLAETKDGDLVEFDSNAPEGTYKVLE